MTDDSDASGWGGIADEYKQEDRDETGETNETMGTTDTSETAGASETSGTNGTPTTSETNIKQDWNGRTLYLPDELVEEVDIRFDELALEAKRAGDQLKKNRDYYPAVFRAALNETSIEEELGLDGEE